MYVSKRGKNINNAYNYLIVRVFFFPGATLNEGKPTKLTILNYAPSLLAKLSCGYLHR